MAYGWLADANALADRKEEAEFCAGKSFDLAKIGEPWGEVVAYRALAIAAVKEKPTDWNRVDAHMGESLRLAEKRNARPDLAVGCFRYAEMLCDKGDIKQAKDYLNQAVDLFTEMNMTWWIGQTKELREKLL